MKISEFSKRIRFWREADRLGPDVPLTHWRLHFKTTMLALCKRKFKFFSDTAEFRPGAYAVSCANISVGNRVIIRPGSMLFAESVGGAEIIIEDDVMLGCGVHIYIDNHSFSDPQMPIIDQGYSPSRPVVLKRGCWIGANSIILSGVVIGENAVIGAGSIVTKSIPDGVVAAGNPARILRAIGGARDVK